MPQPFFVRASRFKCSNQWKRHRHQKCFKKYRALGFEFSILYFVYGATTVAKASLFSTWTRSTVSFYSMYAQKLTRLAVNKIGILALKLTFNI